MTKVHERRDPKLYLKEIIEYIDDIKDITQGLTYETFLQHKINMHALKDVLRDIAEAVWKYQRIKSKRPILPLPHPLRKTMRHETRTYTRILQRKLAQYGTQR